MKRKSAKLAALCVSVLALVLPSVCQVAQEGLWSGQVQCQLSVQSQGFVHQEIQTWTLTGGAPTPQSSMQIYPATWSVTGQGSAQRPLGAQVMAAQWKNTVQPTNAPITIFVRPSDNRLIIKLWHSQLSVFGATNSVRQVGSAQTSTAYTAYEWPFPAIEDVATSTNVTGTGTVPVTGNSIPVPSANSSGVANCKWQFTKGGNAPTKSVPPSNLVESSATVNSARALNSPNAVSNSPMVSGSLSRSDANLNSSTGASPSDPTGFTAQQTGPGQVQLKWNAVSGVTTYFVGGPGAGPNGLKVTGTITTLNNIPNGQQQWTVASWYDPGGLLTNWQSWPKAGLNVASPGETPFQTSSPPPGPAQIAAVLKISDPGASTWETLYKKTTVGSWRDDDNWVGINQPTYVSKQGVQLSATTASNASSITSHLDPPVAGQYSITLDLQCEGRPAHVQLTQSVDSYNRVTLGDWVEQTQSLGSRTFVVQKDVSLTPGGFQFFTWTFVPPQSGNQIPTCTFIDLNVSQD